MATSDYRHVPENQVNLKPGDLVRVRLPHSEAMMAASKAGQVWTVRLRRTSVQLVDTDGRDWGAPYLPSECGIYGGGLHGPFYAYGFKIEEQG